MAKIAESEARNFHGIFVCKKCKSKIRTSSMKVSEGKVSCRKCKSKQLRPLRKK